MNYVDVGTSADKAKEIFSNPDIVLRLNPSWYVREIIILRENLYRIRLYDDKTENNTDIVLAVEINEKSIKYTADNLFVEFTLNELSPDAARITVSGNLFREEDIPYWFKGLQNYFVLVRKQSRLIKQIIDRIWLRMTPSQRRIAIIIIVAEGLGLIALVAVIFALKILR